MEQERRRLAEEARLEAIKALCFLGLVGLMTTLVAFLALRENTHIFLATVITTWGVTVNQCRQHLGAVRERFDVKGEVIHTRHEVRELLNNQGLAQRDRDESTADTLAEVNLVKQHEMLNPIVMNQLRTMFTEISVQTFEAIADAVIEKALAEYHRKNHEEKLKN